MFKNTLPMNSILQNTFFNLRHLIAILIISLFGNYAQAQVNVNSTGGLTSTTTYSTLKLAFDSINVGKHTGSIVITLTGNTFETATAVINASGTGGASYSSMTIKPTGGGLKTIAGNLAAPLIDFNGADNITIDGLYPGNDSLLIVNNSNASTSGTSTIRFINGATKNTIQNCGVFGGSASTTSGSIFISTDAVANGNDSNKIISVLMGPASSSSTPRYGIYASGSTGKENTNNLISGCWIYDFYAATTGDRAGIYAGSACSDFTMYGNSFFQTSARSISSATYSGIYINNTSGGNFIIRKNKIGGSAADCAGTPTALTTSAQLQAIYLNVSTSSRTTIDSNEISNITMATTNTSILQSLLHINNGKVNVFGNSFGSQSVTGSISLTSTPSSTTFSIIGMGSGTFDTINISGNLFGSTSISGSGGTSLRGIDITGSTASMIINNNTFGSPSLSNCWYNATSNSILAIIMRANYAGFVHQINNNIFSNMNSVSGTTRCIYTGGSTSVFEVKNNLIYNIFSSRNSAGTGVNASVIAIISGGGGTGQTITNNTIHTIKNTGGGAMTVSGITMTGATTGTNTVAGNLIHSLNVDGAGGGLNGIDITTGSARFYNNMIRLGLDENGNPVTTSLTINGINEDGGTNAIYYNSIAVVGTNVSTGSANTCAMASSLTSTSREIKNNIFLNTRTNGTSTGKHAGIKLGTVSTQAINSNNYYTGPSFLNQYNGTDYTSLSAWQAATGQDSISVTVNPLFKNAAGTSATIDLHIDTTGAPVSFLESAGMTISGINTDYDNNNRPGPTGSVRGGGSKTDIGADEFDGVPRPNCANTSAGNAVSATDTICNSGSVLLSLSGSTGLGTGNAYQWQSSANGTTFTNITGAVQDQYVATITATTWFRCVVTCSFGSTSSTSGSKKITFLAPQITSTTPGQSCGSGTVILGASSNGIVRWYNAPTGGTLLDTGVTFTTPYLSSSVTYYAEAKLGNCISPARTAVLASIRAIPSITSSAGTSICGPGSATINATASAGTVSWYAAATGGTALYSGNAFVTPSVSATTTYYAEAQSFNCVSSPRTAVTVTVIALPTISSTSPSGTCGPGTVTIGATPSSGTVYWFSSASGGGSLDTGNTFTTPLLNSTRTYYAEVQSNGCTSASRTAVAAFVYNIPTINGVTNNDGCKGSTVTLSAVPSAGTIRWYAASSGGTPLFTGNNFTTPALSSTTTYYAEAYANGCSSTSRSAVTATILPIPVISSVIHGIACGSGTVNLSASAASGTISWFADSTGGTALTTGNTFTTPALSTTTRYWVEVKDNICTSAPRVPVSAIIKPLPTITASNPAASCRPSAFVLNATASAGQIKWYSSAVGGALLGSGNTFTTPVISTTTTYYAEATDSPCVTASRKAITAVVQTPINKTTALNGNTITANASVPSYQWVDCNNNYAPIAGATSNQYTATKNGSYAVILKDANNCSDTSACVLITKIGMNARLDNTGIHVFPNPAGEAFTIVTTDDFMPTVYLLVDALGKAVWEGNLNPGRTVVNTSFISPGIYYLTIDGIEIHRITVMH